MEVQLLQNLHMALCAFHHALSGRSAILFMNVLFQRTAVNADANRYMVFLTYRHNRLHIFFAADISRIQTYLINAGLYRSDGQSIVIMNIRNKRDMCTLPDFSDGSCIRFIYNRHAHQLTANLFQL